MGTIKTCLALFVLTTIAVAQSASAVCNYPYTLTGTQATGAQSNRKSGCASWSFTYSGTAPVNVETSQDGTTWGTSGITVTSGALPTTSGFGVVKFDGYAPYLRIKASGTPSQTVTGLLYGSLGLTAGGGALQNWQYRYTPLVTGEWTGPVITNATSTRVDNADSISFRHNSNAGTVIGNFICRAHTITTGQTIRGTYMIAPSNYQNDGGAQLSGFVFRNSTSGAWGGAILETAGASNERMNFGSFTNNQGAGYSSFNGGFQFSFADWGTGTPITTQYVVTASDIEFSMYSAFGASYPRGTVESVPRATITAAFDQLCFVSFVPNGNYFMSLLALGFSST